MNEIKDNALMTRGPRDITDERNFTQEIQKIENNQALSMVDKFKAKQQEINHRLDSYRNYLLARKDVEAKAITLEAQKAIMALESQQVQMMKDLGLDHSDEVSDTLIKAGTMLTRKLEEVSSSVMTDAIKQRTIDNIGRLWTVWIPTWTSCMRRREGQLQ